ncbi:efflux RND transporter permease subunit [Butyricicoccus pullicaecorum]|uniref:efflux RND transporter permease subunit n=1 Tax=Butyricicoccus pullicaecorum TaxID=501571 RepID=UPI0035220FEA
MNIADFCLKHKVTTIMAYVLIVVFGIMGFTSLPLALLPDIELPMAVVYTTYSNAGPQEVENMVTKTIESACASVSGMDEIQSLSSEGSSMVMVTFADGTDMDEAMVDLRDRIDRVKGFLPEDADAPMAMTIDVDAMPVVTVGLKGADLAELQAIAEDDIQPALERIDGVASVDIAGGYENEIAIDTDADRLAGYGLSVSYIAQMLAAENIALPAGEVQSGDQSFSVRTDGEYSSISDIANTLILLPTGGTVRLSEVANVYVAPKEQTAIAKIGGEPCITISVNKQSDTNTLQVAERAKDALNEVTALQPTLDWSLLMDQSDMINMTVDSVIQNIVFGVLLAAIVLFVFLRDLGATAVISVSMPICIISVFLIMQVFDITMNMMSLGGIAMGVGMIVDNSIVVLENIFHYRSDGCDRFTSCVEGTKEVALSISASTLTTVAVFLPIGLSGGLSGMMFREFCITICSLLLASLLIALTLVPVLCYALLDRGGKHRMRMPDTGHDIADRPLMRKYKKLLAHFITHRKKAIIISGAMIVAFLGSIAIAGVELMPQMDESMVAIGIEMPVGSDLEDVSAMADRAVDIALKQVPEIESIYYSTGGASMSTTSTANSASITVNLVDKSDRDRTSQQVADDLRPYMQDLAGAEISVEASGTMDMSSMTGDAISVTLRGDDYDKLSQTAEQLAGQLAALPGAIEVSSSASDQVPEVEITLNRANASRFGLTAATIGQAVRGELSGQTATQLKVNGEEITVTVRGDSRAETSIDALKSVMIPTQTGGSVPLSLVANVDTVLAPQSINRLNQSRTVTITGGAADTVSTAEMSQAVQGVLDTFELPDGITYETGGEMEEMINTFTQLAYALVVALGLVYFVLASQFESFVMPVIIMTILPIGLLGSLFTLPLTGNKISMVAFIGVIMLAGTVVNSSIVLIDYMNIRRKRGEDKDTAILNACPRRVRPVLMTTLTTVLGLLPMVFSNGEGAEMMRPMAIVMITGMVVSTIVTLLFTPVYYSLIDSLTQRVRTRSAERHARRLARDTNQTKET